ncbi:hypothetical protein AKUH4B114J_01460 [Apilactobacillus kunkeei]|nr:hypothetical protein AKUH4B102A_01390 [Apilactobacillus kunkeei]CAI2556360.1 hypothetical protein AKUH4B405J_01380 [Apilactobacillus kunkeei]CAI2556600.1 hypothetical protein AKUH3B101X_01450 [Apilactobacillus kunkeei]CAI2556983.1 hypothetical protein AKUH4B410M_01380 [Apilactobacillus kunkeei]CAI2557035.1 hypothetical protein AKUH2B105J_01450 [Apilactobacillus kunkeei]
MKNKRTISIVALLLINLSLISNENLPHNTIFKVLHLILFIALCVYVIFWIKDYHKK